RAGGRRPPGGDQRPAGPRVVLSGEGGGRDRPHPSPVSVPGTGRHGVDDARQAVTNLDALVAARHGCAIPLLAVESRNPTERPECPTGAPRRWSGCPGYGEVGGPPVR